LFGFHETQRKGIYVFFTEGILNANALRVACRGGFLDRRSGEFGGGS
jgi:hypothetical protein